MTYEPREGLEVGPLEGDDTVKWWLLIANDRSRSDLERVGAVIALLNKKAQIQVVLDG